MILLSIQYRTPVLCGSSAAKGLLPFICIRCVPQIPVGRQIRLDLGQIDPGLQAIEKADLQLEQDPAISKPA
jgi:hypothetical protein